MAVAVGSLQLCLVRRLSGFLSSVFPVDEKFCEKAKLINTGKGLTSKFSKFIFHTDDLSSNADGNFFR